MVMHDLHINFKSLEYVNRPFIEFLKHKELTPNLIQFIVHAIAMVNEDTPTIEVHSPSPIPRQYLLSS